MGTVGHSEQGLRRLSRAEETGCKDQVVAKSLCVWKATGSTMLLGLKKKKKKRFGAKGRICGYSVVKSKLEVGKSPRRVLNTSLNFTPKCPKEGCEQRRNKINLGWERDL